MCVIYGEYHHSALWAYGGMIVTLQQFWVFAVFFCLIINFHSQFSCVIMWYYIIDGSRIEDKTENWLNSPHKHSLYANDCWGRDAVGFCGSSPSIAARECMRAFISNVLWLLHQSADNHEKLDKAHAEKQFPPFQQIKHQQSFMVICECVHSSSFAFIPRTHTHTHEQTPAKHHYAGSCIYLIHYVSV